MFNLLSSRDEGRMLALHGGEGFVGRARNQIVSRFLESDFTDLLMIDSDILYGPEHVDRIASHNVPVVAGFYPKKAPGSTVWVANHHKANDKVNEDGLVRVSTIGTGFIKIQRKVLEKMRDTHLASRYIVDGTDIVEYEFFPFRVVNGKLRSEDWAFCDNCHELGFPVYGDTKCLLRHFGSAIYPTPEAQSVDRLLKVVNQLQHRGIEVPKDILEALRIDESYNVGC